MALFRPTPICSFCGKPSAKARYRDQSNLPLTMRVIGDTFEGWEEIDCCPDKNKDLLNLRGSI